MGPSDVSTQDPELSIVIVNYNGGRLLEQCLQALQAHPPSCSYEVVIVDNGSTDGSPDRVEAQYPSARLVRSVSNVGLARAFNIALKLASGRFVLSLDSDTRVTPNALSSLMARMEAASHVGIIGAALLNPDLSVQKTARRAPTPLNAVFGRRSLVTKLFPNNRFSRRYLMDDRVPSDAPYAVDWVSTAALLIRREALDAVGGLDEAFFVYWVDADWCARVRKAGWAIETHPGSKVIHDENLKGGHRTRRRTRMILDFHDGAYRYYRKHHVSHALSPLNAFALVGLSTRAAIFIVWDFAVTAVNRSRSAASKEFCHEQ
ncbi:MAG TPA: glycosyltransferase family 2 protein [Vicinamibacterales bacterium]|nr:glycosyltransferase family 2 protein [Vicinamibacterales bacterium]